MHKRWGAAALALTLALLALGERVSASAFGAWQGLVHALSYALLCGMYAGAFARAHWSLVLALGAAVALGQEIYQALAGSHAVELDDLVYDGLGAVLGTALGIRLARARRSLEIT